MNETEQVIDGLDEVEIANTSIDEIDSENINLIFVGIDKSGSMGMYERDMVKLFRISKMHLSIPRNVMRFWLQEQTSPTVQP